MSLRHRVALLQSDSEMLRYSFADVRSTLAKLEYEWSYYTAENIKDLFPRLDRYDALVLATNSCSDEHLMSALVESKATIASYLENSAKGLYVSFQRRLTEDVSAGDYAFLPEDLGVKACGRPSGENPSDGHIAISAATSEHYLFRHPHRVSADQLARHALTNSEVSGYYWGYLKPEPESHYEVLVHDDHQGRPRPLMLLSQPQVPSRVIVTSLVLDWQRHDALWENALRYVVEGSNSVAIIKRKGMDTFDLDYLQSSLTASRIGYTVYEQDTLDAGRIPPSLHPTLVMDPQWAVDDVRQSLSYVSALPAGTTTVNFFDLSGSTSTIVSTLSRRKPFAGIADSVLAWLRGQYSDGFWDGSFWTSIDVLETFVQFGESVDIYKRAIKRDVEIKRRSDGSYDHVFGATLAMVELDVLFGDTTTLEHGRSLEWVETQFSNQSIYNQATAIEVLNGISSSLLSKEQQEQVLHALASAVTPTTYLDVLRYTRTLLALGDVDSALRHAKSLSSVARPGGQWLNVAAAAETVATAIRLEQRSDGNHPDLASLIFDGVEFLRFEFTAQEGHWHHGVIPTAKALQALKTLQERVSFPADEVASSIAARDQQGRGSAGLVALSARNHQLQTNQNDLEEELERVSSARISDTEALKSARRWALTLSFATDGLSLGLTVTTLAAIGDLADVVHAIKGWQEFAWPLVLVVFATLPILLAAILARRLGTDLGPLHELARRLPLRGDED